MTKIRHSALGHSLLGVYRVKVIFIEKGKECGDKGVESAYWMSRDTYHSCPFGVETTLEDYKKHGEVVEAGDTDIYSAN